MLTDDRRTPMTDELREWCIGHASVAIECALQTLSEEQGTLAAAAAYDDIAPQIREVYAARIAALEEALRFYARPQSWRSCGVYMSGRNQATAAEIDGGERARAALEQTP